MKEEKRVSYQAGITRKPSDFLCQEGELAECINMTSDGEELKVLQPLTVKCAPGKKLLFVHRLPGGQENYIYEIPDSNGYYLYHDDTMIAMSGHREQMNTANLTSIGKTIIVNAADEDDEDGVVYYIWKNNAYKRYDGVKAPDLLEFWVAPLNNVSVSQSYEGSQLERKGSGNGATLRVKDQSFYNDLVVGLYEKALHKIAEDKNFARPFMIRYAIELFDGSYTAISNPIICYAGIKRNAYASISDNEVALNVKPFGLRYLANYDYSDLSDIVRNVVVFASPAINLYDMAGDQKPKAKSSENVWCDFTDNDGDYTAYNLPNNSDVGTYFSPLNAAGAIEKSIESTSTFFKIAELGLKQDGYGYMYEYIDLHTITNLTSQEQLPLDYYSNSRLNGDGMISYNGRLMLTNARRTFFAGFKYFSSWWGTTDGYSHIFIYISTDSGDKVVHQKAKGSTVMGHYIYYPDPRAYKAVLFLETDNGTVQYQGTVPLKEHPRMNGAYFYSGLPSSSGLTLPKTSPNPVFNNIIVNSSPEILNGHLYMSEVNNPFVFSSRGDISVGTGRILGAAPITQALSQGQFGQFPLIAFCTDGIWALSLNSEGVFTSTTPMSREVALERNPCITQTDDAIFFISKKGLMAVAGNEVRCVSEQMNGVACNTGMLAGLTLDELENGNETEQWAYVIDHCSGSPTFREQILRQGVRIAYDYTDSRLLLLRPNAYWCWVYNIKDGCFSKMILPSSFISVVNNYPDTLIQMGDTAKTVYSLYDEYADEAADNVRQQGFILTRPMKLGGPLTVASLRELKHVGCWNERLGSCVKTMVLISDNLTMWYKSGSRMGVAAKYYRLALFVRMAPHERLSGTIIRKENRREENLR